MNDNRLKNISRRRALRIAGIYALFGLLWITASDRILSSVVQDSAALIRFSMYKGWIFILVTALLVLYLTSKAFGKQERLTETLRHSEAKFRSYIEYAPHAVLVVDREGRYVDFNSAALDLLGYDSTTLLSMHIPDIVSDENRELVTRDFESLILEGHVEGEYRLKRCDGNPVSVSVRAVRIADDRFMAFCQDITQRKAHEREIEKLTHLYATLSRINQSIVRVRLREELFQEVCRITAEHAGFKVVWVGMHDSNTHVVVPVARAGDSEGYVDKVKVYTDDRTEGHGPVGTCIREGRPSIFNDFLNDLRALPWHAEALSHGLRAVASFPIRLNGGIYGAFTVYAAEPNVFQDREIALLEEAAVDISFALKRLHEEDKRRQAEEALRESEERHRAALDNMMEGCQIVGSDWRYLYINDSAARHARRPKDELLGRTMTEAYPGIRQTSMFATLGRCMDERKSARMENEFAFPDGSKSWFELSIEPVPEGLFILSIDITERKLAEERLRHSRERYHSLFENMLDGYAYCKMLYEDGKPEDFVYIDVNPAFERLTGLTGVVGRKVSEVIPGIRQTNPELFEIYGRVALTGTPERFETYVDSIGHWFSVAVFSPEKEHFVAVFDNVTERRKALAALEEEAVRRRILIEQSGDGIVVIDRNGKVYEANQRYADMLGYSAEEVRQLYVWDWDSQWTREQILEMIRLVDAAGDHFETRQRRKDGTFIDVEISSNGAELGGQKLVFCVCRDISERKAAEKALNESERRYRALVDNALAGVIRSDVEGNILYANDEALRIFECGSSGEMFSKDLWTRYRNPKDRDGLLDRLQKYGVLSNCEVEAVTRKGRDITVLINASLDDGTITSTVLDITEHKKLEEQFRQAQKMEAVGVLAGGVAHDFNNILTAIIGFSNIMLMKMQGNDPLRHYIDQILESSNRATILTNSLLAFSRKQPIKLAVIDLNEVISGFEKFLLRLIREDIELKIMYTEADLSVLADRGQIEQMIMNLVANARDAMPGGGRLAVETKLVTLGREFLEINGFGKVGDYALLSVTDTGSGMDKKTTSRIFEPFFTTKGQGRGTGLGLSMVYGIVKKHEGFINVYSEPGKGTAFKIYLPIVRAAVDAGKEKMEEEEAPMGGTETILVAEDDEALREANRVMLDYFGYSVIEAVDGADAVSKYMMNKDRIKLIIMDGIMPKMNGKEAFRAIKAMNPRARCIFMSGYAEDIFAQKDVTDDETEFMLKPVSPVDLLKKMREVLDSPARTV